MIGLFAGHRTAANILMLALLVLGAAAAPMLQRDTFPEIPPSDVEVRIAYPGASPADVEENICRVVEDPIRAVQYLAELSCRSRDNLAIITAEMVEGSDMDRFAADVEAAVKGVTAFPDKVEEPVTRIIERVATVASIAVTGPEDPSVLLAYADQVAERLKADPAISQADVEGFSEREIAVEISNASLRRHGLTISDVAEALTRNSYDLPAGTLEGPQGDILVRFAGMRRSPATLATIPVVGAALGSEVMLGDVATINYRFSDESTATYFDGERAAIITVSKTSSQDALNVMTVVRKHLETAAAVAPAGINLSISQDMTTNIVERLRIITSNGIQGLVLVLAVMGLFFGVRFSFWVALGLPVSFLGTVFVMQVLGLSLNMITMVALLIAIGLLMDDSIVISENIVRRRQAGESPTEAAINGVKQVGPGVLSSFVTTVMVVGPLAFMAGQIGAVLKFLPFVLLITLIVSLVEAFLILPNHLRHALHGSSRQSLISRSVNGMFDRLRDDVIVPAARLTMRFRYLTLGIAGFLLLTSLMPFAGGILKFQSFPTLESDTVEARFLLPQGTPLAQTRERVAKAVAALDRLNAEETPKQPDGQALVQNVTVSFGVNPDVAETGSHLATISGKLLPAGVRTTNVTDIVDRWKALTGPLPDMVSLRFTDKERGVGGKPIDVRLQGPDLSELQATARDLTRFFSAFEGVRDVSHDLRPGKREYVVTLRPASASALGVNAQAAATQLRAALRGDTGLEVTDAVGQIDIVAPLAGADRKTLDDIARLQIAASNGALVPLSAVADVTETRGYSSIVRIDGQRTVSVTGAINPDVANARELMAAMRADFLPGLAESRPDVRVRVTGEEEDTSTTGTSLMRNLALGLIGVYFVLAFQFGSFIQPVAVIFAIPLAVIGVMWGHVLMGMQLSLPSLVGLATLAGVVVNNSILLIGFMKDNFNATGDLAEAGANAVRDRFRSIFLTSLTTVVGLGPLLLEQSTQAQFLRPIVTSLAFGLTAATLLALFVTPATIAILHDMGLMKREEQPAAPAGARTA